LTLVIPLTKCVKLKSTLINSNASVTNAKTFQPVPVRTRRGAEGGVIIGGGLA
jgi:hypothetical protein